jgi:hypothetical protein
MKKKYILFCILMLSQIAWGQEFSFQMNFQDSAGNKDSLTLGYDVTATDSIDASFGETNIISTPLSAGLDVRVTNEWFKRNLSSPTTGTFHTKKQIVDKDFFPFINIDIFTNHWPVTASWDNLQFNNNVRNGSIFTSINPGGWWDTGSPSNLYKVDFKSTNQVTFTSNISVFNGFFNDNYAYINGSNDTISVFWLAFGDSTSFPTGINKTMNLEDIKIYPNPVTNYLNIQSTEPNLKIAQIQLFDLSGKEQQIELTDDPVNLEGIPEGMYFIRLTLQNGQTVMKKIIKK